MFGSGCRAAPFHDIKHVPGTTADLEAACLQEPTCCGFNSDGYLKNCCTEACVSVSGTDLYVRQSAPQPAAPPSLVPLPTKFTRGTSSLAVNAAKFQFTVVEPAGSPPADLEAAFSRAAALMFLDPARAAPGAGALVELKVSVANVSAPLALGVDESYELDIPADGSAATLTAETLFGAYNGLTTLAQLVRFDYDSHSHVIQEAPWTIIDAPKFSWRGLLIDSSRHFEPVGAMKRYIDSMTLAKLNTVHWHITDEQAVPLESTTHPKLWNGAWSKRERYTHEDIRAVVEYARQRGVRVVPEVDTPGHEASWCVGYPEVCPSPSCPMPLRPDTNATFDLISGIFEEFAGQGRAAGSAPIFTDEYLHLGGDEVSTTCWEQNATIMAWLRSKNLTADGGYEYFVKRAHDLASAVGRRAVVWEEVWQHFGTALPKDTVIEAWLTTEAPPNATSHGYSVVWAVDGRWYLDHLDVSWESMYAQDPLAGITNPAQQALVVGGEGCMWGETVDNSDWMATVWPRAAAIAERLWSYDAVPQTAAGLAGVRSRLSWFRCAMNRWGFGAAPLDNLLARSAPSGPGSCYDQ